MEINRVLVVGAGTMGYSLALTFARGGYDVGLVDKDDRILAGAVQLIGSALETLKQAGLADDAQIEQSLARITTTTDLAAAAQTADLVIEAVSENVALKKRIFSVLDAHCPPHAILTSNTSFLNIFEIAETGRPDKVMMAHWFAPPHIIPLVELVADERTAPETVETVSAVLERLGKKPLRMERFVAGFLVNRLQRALLKEAYYLLNNGYAGVEQIDAALKASIGIRLPIVGILKSLDFTGLDLVMEIRNNATKAPDPQYELPAVIRETAARGEYGVKTGKGLYDYGGKSTEQILRERDLQYLKVRETLAGLEVE